jgi:rhomboid family GlyGly-CTERM serine protease
VDNLKKWFPVLIVFALLLCFQLVGPELLRYQTTRIQEYELWRLFTAHWVHANWVHFWLNMAGLMLCFALTNIHWNSAQWLWRICFLSIAISAGFYLLQPQIGWYVGFSGVLFGLYVLAAVGSLSKQFAMSVILLLFIGLKISLEQWSSVKISSSELIGVPVLVDAHFYGVLIASVLVVIQLIWQQLSKQD